MGLNGIRNRGGAALVLRRAEVVVVTLLLYGLLYSPRLRDRMDFHSEFSRVKRPSKRVWALAPGVGFLGPVLALSFRVKRKRCGLLLGLGAAPVPLVLAGCCLATAESMGCATSRVGWEGF